MKPKSAVLFRHRILMVSALCIPALLLVAAGAPSHGAAHKRKAPTAKEQFKNIKVLKTLPADQLIPVMRKFNASLGVKCDFCHVEGPNHSGFEKDDKPAKGTARKMLLMVNDMNSRYGVVRKQTTCYMCHHGRPEPERDGAGGGGGPRGRGERRDR